MKPSGQMQVKQLPVAGLFLFLAPALASGQIVEYAHLDAVGNVRAVTNQAGQVIERHDYLPFGEECTTGPCASNPGVGAGQPRKFTGKERDTETGFDYFGARYYQAKLGRFTTTDPVYTWRENFVDPQRWNRYAYARNNPLRYTDPDGKVIVPIVIALAVFYVLNNPTVANVTEGPTIQPILPNSAVTAAVLAAHAAFSRDAAPDTRPPPTQQPQAGSGADARLEARLNTLGRPGENKGIREVVGDASDARNLFDELRGDNPVKEAKAGVFVAEGRQGGHVTFRSQSKSGPPTVDVHGITEGVRKIKFVDQ